MSRIVVLVSSSLLLSYTGYIYSNNKTSNNSSSNSNSFVLGSADDIVRDNLNTGDIILFHRRWYNYHIPIAISIKIYQYINDNDYDHAGIIIQDQYGVPYVYENTPFQGYKVHLSSSLSSLSP